MFVAVRCVPGVDTPTWLLLFLDLLVSGIEGHRLDRPQPEHLDRSYTDLLDKGLSPTTVLRAHRMLSRSLKVQRTDPSHRGHTRRPAGATTERCGHRPGPQ